MLKIRSGWLKIYLFYGMVFFLLGIFGILVNHEQRWRNWSKIQFNQFNTTVRSFVPTGEEQVLPVFTERLPAIYLLSHFHNELNPQTNLIQQEVATTFQSKFRKIITIPIDNSGQLEEQTQKYTNQEVPWLFIGVDISIMQPNILKYQLSLAAPSETIANISDTLFQNIVKRITNLTLNKSTIKSTDFIEFYWQGIQSGNSDQLEILTDLLKTITQKYIQKASPQRLD